MTTQGTGNKVTKAVWHKNIVHTFCDVCIRGIEKMYKPLTHFTKEGWEFIVKEFQKETGLNFEQKQLRNRWDSLKRDYKSWKDLMRNETGLGWDAHKNTVSADDAWWEEKIKVNSNFAIFKINGIEPQLEEKLDLMFSKIVATGEFAMTPETIMQVGVEGDCHSTEWDPFEDNLDVESTQPSLVTKKRKIVDNSNIAVKKGNRQSGGAAILAKQIDTLVSAVASRTRNPVVKVTEPEVPSLRVVVADIKTIPGIDIESDLFMFAIEFVEVKARRGLS